MIKISVGRCWGLLGCKLAGSNVDWAYILGEGNI